MLYEKGLQQAQRHTDAQLFDVPHAQSLVGTTYHNGVGYECMILSLFAQWFYVRQVTPTADYYAMESVFDVYAAIEKDRLRKIDREGGSLIKQYFSKVEALAYLEPDEPLIRDNQASWVRDPFGIFSSFMPVLDGASLLEETNARASFGHTDYWFGWQLSFHGYTYHHDSAMVTEIRFECEDRVDYVAKSDIWKDDAGEVHLKTLDPAKFVPITLDYVRDRVQQMRTKVVDLVLEKFADGAPLLQYHAKTDVWYNATGTWALRVALPDPASGDRHLSFYVSEVRANGTWRPYRGGTIKKRPSGGYTPMYTEELHKLMDDAVASELQKLTPKDRWKEVQFGPGSQVALKTGLRFD